MPIHPVREHAVRGTDETLDVADAEKFVESHEFLDGLSTHSVLSNYRQAYIETNRW